MMNQSLEEFDRMLKQGNYPIYDQAVEQNREYMEDRSHRLTYLRAKLYDVHKAVNQLVNHLHQKAKYFGEDTLARDITLDDLNSEDLEVLLSGTFHIQADRDPIGRAIIYCLGTLLGRWRFENIIRAHYYMMFNILLRIEAVQLKGLVVIYYDGSERIGAGSLSDMIMSLKAYRSSIPVRYSATHVCLPRSIRQPWNEHFIVANFSRMAQYALTRTRVHYGSHLEVQHSLRGYGIQLGSFPVDLDGNIRTGILNAWFVQYYSAKEEGRGDLGTSEVIIANAVEEDRAAGMVDREASSLSSDQNANNDQLQPMVEADDSRSAAVQNAPNDQLPSVEAAEMPRAAVGVNRENSIVQPLQLDVLLGRGVRLMKHPGNIRFREFVLRYQDRYDRAERSRRRRVCSEVVQTLSSQGIRFLQRNGNGDWVESALSEVEEKVKQLFRSQRKQMKKSQS